MTISVPWTKQGYHPSSGNCKHSTISWFVVKYDTTPSNYQIYELTNIFIYSKDLSSHV